MAPRRVYPGRTYARMGANDPEEQARWKQDPPPNMKPNWDKDCAPPPEHSEWFARWSNEDADPRLDRSADGYMMMMS